MILDRDIAQGRQSFKPQYLSIYKTDIIPILTLTDQIPEFGSALKGVLNKTWRFDSPADGFAKCPTENSYEVRLKGNIIKVACQTSNEVVINPNWYEKLASKSCKKLSNVDAILILKQKQKDLFVHELLLGVTLGTNISQDSISQVFAMLTRQPLPSAQGLQMLLESSHFGVFKIASNSCQNGLGCPSEGIQNSGSLVKRSAKDAQPLPEYTNPTLNILRSKFDQATPTQIDYLEGKTWDCTLIPLSGAPEKITSRYSFSLDQNSLLTNKLAKSEEFKSYYFDGQQFLASAVTDSSQNIRGEAIRLTSSGDVIVEDFEKVRGDQYPDTAISLPGGEVISYVLCPRSLTH